MNRKEFIAEMELRLLRLPKADRDDILSDYEAHFAAGIEKGRTEEEVSAELGNPDELAAVYLENLPENAKGAPPEPKPEEQQETCGGEQAPFNQYAPPAQNQYYVPAPPEPRRDNTAGIVTVVLLCVLVVPIVVWLLFSALSTLVGISVGFGGASVALFVLGALAMALNTMTGIGLMLLGTAMVALCGLGIIATIASVKLVIRMTKWYIGWCKKQISGGNN